MEPVAANVAVPQLAVPSGNRHQMVPSNVALSQQGFPATNGMAAAQPIMVVSIFWCLVSLKLLKLIHFNLPF